MLTQLLKLIRQQGKPSEYIASYQYNQKSWIYTFNAMSIKFGEAEITAMEPPEDNA
ncbi:hypothetical protein D3C85_1706410 [compost metagenome]